MSTKMPATLNSKNIGYAKAFWHVATAYQIHGYRIFYGALRKVLRCRDGFLLSYSIPSTYNSKWKPVTAHIPRPVLDEFGVRSGCVEFFPIERVSSKVHSTGQRTPILKPCKNKLLHFSPANPFLDTSRTVSHSGLSMVVWNDVSQPFII
jgi:hypothetical protein